MQRITENLRKRWWMILLLILIVGGVVYFVRSRNGAGSQLESVTVKLGDIEETIEVPGVVDARKKATLKFLAGGKLTSLPVSEGQPVRKNQLIAAIDAKDLQKNLQKSLNLYKGERLDFEQDKDDRQDLARNDDVLRLIEQSQLDLENSVLDVELRDIALKNASLVSPIDGVVTHVPIEVAGVQVTATDAFEIVDPTTLMFEAEIDEIDVGSVTIGTPVRIVLDAYPDENIEGTIDFIGLKAQASTKSSGGTVFPIRVAMPSAGVTRYRLGLNGTMSIILRRQENALVLPIEAVVFRDEKAFVQIKDPLNPKKPVEREVMVGIEGESEVEILSGVSEGDEVVITE